VNAKTEEMFGYTRAELLGSGLEILLPENLRRAHIEHRTNYFLAPRSRPMGVGMELRGRKKDGTEFPVEISLSFVREAGGQLALALITDISARKQIELQMRQGQKLESMGVLAGGVAHDFNNLLTGIIGNASLVLEGLGPDHPMRSHVQEVVEAGHHAAALTRQLLAYAGKGQFDLREIDLASLLREVEALVRSSVPSAVRVLVDLPERLPPVSGDAGQLQQLFLSLIINAAEAIDGAHGTVRISGLPLESAMPLTGRFSATGVPPGRYIAVDVKDDGCGMDESTTSRIFDPFFTTKFMGRGLGLSAARGIVEAHRGAIQVSSAPGEGTTFTVLLPAAALRQGAEQEGLAVRTSQPWMPQALDPKRARARCYPERKRCFDSQPSWPGLSPSSPRYTPSRSRSANIRASSTRSFPSRRIIATPASGPSPA
jgi:PAS domain S-box-containing protein